MSDLCAGALRLQKFIERHEQTQVAAADAVGVSAPTMHDWLSGAKRPRALHRAAIEVWTRGEVGADSWALEHELDALADVTPFKPARAAGGR